MSKKISIVFFVALALHFVLLNLNQNAHSASSALTEPPVDMSGINEMHKELLRKNSKIRFGTHADPKVITLGPKQGGKPGFKPYKGKHSLDIDMPLDTPILAPIDMTFIGFKNNSAKKKKRFKPFDDLEMCFESNTKDWPGMIVCFYHLRTSPLMKGHLVNDECSRIENYDNKKIANGGGRTFFLMNDAVWGETHKSSRDPKSCQAELGKQIKRGEVIAFSGQVGKNEHLAIRFKVKSDKQNPLMLKKKAQGDPYLHWVQPAKFFYWKCFTPQTEFPEGVLAYPFQCNTATPAPKATATPESTPTPIPGVPLTSASAVTSPPPSMEGINTHTEMYGTGADPNIITLGPKVGGHPNSTPYTYKTSLNFQQVKHGAPLLAPIDMVFIGFKNRNAKYRIKLIDGNSANQLPDGQNKVYITPFNDLELCFESSSPDWPGMIICTYHLSTSPLLLGHNQNPDCGEVEEWGSTQQVQGHIFYAVDDYSQENGNARSCEALIGHSIKRGEVIGFAGSVGHPRSLKEKNEGEYITVGTNPQAPFRFKVSHTSENPTVQKGNRYLHWVQPGSFFYWKCYTPDTHFPSGVLAYPFKCNK